DRGGAGGIRGQARSGRPGKGRLADQVLAHHEELLADVDPRPADHEVPTTGFASTCVRLGLTHDRTVRRVAIAHPEAAALLTELEVRLRHRLADVEDRNQLIDVLAGLRRRVPTDETGSRDR